MIHLNSINRGDKRRPLTVRKEGTTHVYRNISLETNEKTNKGILSNDLHLRDSVFNICKISKSNVPRFKQRSSQHNRNEGETYSVTDKGT